MISFVFFSPEACGNKVDPVYEALRFGTSLAQKAKRASGSESPQRNSVRSVSVSDSVDLSSMLVSCHGSGGDGDDATPLI